MSRGNRRAGISLRLQAFWDSLPVDPQSPVDSSFDPLAALDEVLAAVERLNLIGRYYDYQELLGEGMHGGLRRRAGIDVKRMAYLAREREIIEAYSEQIERLGRDRPDLSEASRRQLARRAIIDQYRKPNGEQYSDRRIRAILHRGLSR